MFLVTFKSRVASKKFPEDTMEDKQLIMNVALYCSDHAAPSKNSVMYFKWMAVEMEEYYQQGDLERKLDFTVSPFFDRATCNPFKFQLGYIDVIAIPLFDTWCEFMPSLHEVLITEGLDVNRRLLTQKIDETKSMADQQTNVNSQQQSKLTEASKDDENVQTPMSPKVGLSKTEKGPEKHVTS